MAIAHSRESFYRLVQRHPERPQVLVEGDSWIGHPLVDNLAVSLNRFFRGRVNILSLGEVGHLAIHMVADSQLKLLRSVLKARQFNFDLVFFSGGGNDIIAHNESGYRLSDILQKSSSEDPRRYIVEHRWLRALERVKSAYKTLIQTRNELRPECPILTHSYDIIHPRDNGADVFIIPDVIGPWVQPVMTDLGIADTRMQQRIIGVLLGDFRDAMQNLEENHPAFHLVDTQDTLPRQQTWSIDVPFWDDEIHPDSEGFHKLVDEKIGPAARALISHQSLDTLNDD